MKRNIGVSILIFIWLGAGCVQPITYSSLPSTEGGATVTPVPSEPPPGGIASASETRAASLPTPIAAAGQFVAQEEPCVRDRGSLSERGWTDSPALPSPDGAYLVYLRNIRGDAKLYITDANDDSEVVVEAPAQAFPLVAVAWSPDSQRIAFSNGYLSQPGGGEIYVVNVNGSDLIHLASYVGYDDALAWSPDGNLLAFSSGEVTGVGSGMGVGEYKLYVISIGLPGQPQVIMNGCDPVWQYEQ